MLGPKYRLVAWAQPRPLWEQLQHPLQTTCAHVPNLHMGNLVQGIFGAKFVNFWDVLAGNAGISLILFYIMVLMGMFQIYDV